MKITMTYVFPHDWNHTHSLEEICALACEVDCFCRLIGDSGGDIVDLMFKIMENDDLECGPMAGIFVKFEIGIEDRESFMDAAKLFRHRPYLACEEAYRMPHTIPPSFIFVNKRDDLPLNFD